jgi:hypothetical protein
MMTLRNPGRLAIHRRSDEIAFLQRRLRALNAACRVNKSQDDALETVRETVIRDGSVEAKTSIVSRDPRAEVLMRERDMADELLHTRQTEPLGETLQRRLAMAERICRDLAPRSNGEEEHSVGLGHGKHWDHLPDAYQVAEIERRALTEMLQRWLGWLRDS